VRLSASGQTLELKEGELFEDDGPAAGYSYQPNEEKLSDRVWIKKELILPNPQAKKATLLVGPGGALKGSVNGKAIDLQRVGKAGNYWEAYSLPPDVLKSGRNDIVLHGSGKVWIARADEFAAGSETRAAHPNRSARSTDGGKTWDHDHLGTASNVDGEYYVRLFLDHYRSSGSLILPVLDAANLTGQAITPPVEALGSLQIRIDAGPASPGQVSGRIRSGHTPRPDNKDWSPWRDLGTESSANCLLDGRYFQFALELATPDPLATPRLNAVTFETTPKRADDWTTRLKVLDAHNEEIIRTSIPFAYEPFDHPRLKTLRERYNLDELVRDAGSELELITRLARWSAKQWDKGHLKEVYPPWDALEILKAHTDGKPIGGFCQQYNLVFLQAC
jgi:hypothetical protein